MSVAAGNPPSDLVLEVRRVSPRRPEQQPLPPPLADPLLDLRGHRDGALLRGQGRPVHPGDRRRGPPVLRLPRILRPPAGRRNRTRPGCHHDQDLTGNAYRSRDCPASSSTRTCGRWWSGAGHRRPARHVRAGLQRQVLRGHGVPGPPELHRQLQRGARAVRHRGPARLAGPQLLLQHLLRRGEPAAVRRALGPSRGLCPAAGHDRPGVRHLGLPR